MLNPYVNTYGNPRHSLRGCSLYFYCLIFSNCIECPHTANQHYCCCNVCQIPKPLRADKAHVERSPAKWIEFRVSILLLLSAETHQIIATV
ncbi:MAG: hypothetical protein R3C18_14225 [Planctomycetaceae bacterium]